MKRLLILLVVLPSLVLGSYGCGPAAKPSPPPPTMDEMSKHAALAAPGAAPAPPPVAPKK